ncbi:MAG: zf-TFIIB domain-containing protein [bacterium]|nr:zf-TFIIB domain-containing protein [bacterium]
MIKKCPHHQIHLAQAHILGVEIDYCPEGYGLWFDENELRLAKDARDRDLRWLDIDLWRDPAKFIISPNQKMCPKDRLPMYEVAYGDSNIKVDVCNLCHGVWLDRGEFKNIVVYLRDSANNRILYHYARDLLEEGWEVFAGPEMLREEVLDFLTVLKLLMYKFAVQYSKLSQIIVTLPK